MSLDFEIFTDTASIKLQIEADIKKVLPILTKQILKDCNSFCKQDQGTLIASSLTASNIPEGDIIWDTVYANRQYFLSSASKSPNSNAAMMWCHKAYEQYGDSWQKLLQKLIEGD